MQQEVVTVDSKGVSWWHGVLTSKTTWVNLGMLVLTLLASPEVLSIIPPDGMKYVPVVVIIVNLALRQFTVAPITGSPGHRKAGG